MSSSIGQKASQSETAPRERSETQSDEPTVSTYLSAMARIGFTTACYWLVGITPEDNHGTKGYWWARVGAYRWAAWHFRKYLKYTEDSWARASLASCYAHLGMTESAIEHYRLAYARNKNPEIAVFLARAAADLGNLDEARRWQAEVIGRLNELSPEAHAELTELECELQKR
jgi:tetratricopeptide (TPR) repeat protein